MAVAADCVFNGVTVNLFELEMFKEKIKPLLMEGGVQITKASETTSGKNGLAQLNNITTNAKEVVAEADVIMITVPAMYHSIFFETILPHLRKDQIILFNTAYWACLRHAKRLMETVGLEVTLAESNIMPYLSQQDDFGVIHIFKVARTMKLAAFPGERTKEVYNVLKQLYPQYEPVPNVLYINLSSGGNSPIHPPMAIPISGYIFDRYKGSKFYSEVTSMGAKLVTAHDHERRKIAQQLGCGTFESESEFIKNVYGYEGKDLADALRKSDHVFWYASDEGIEQQLEEDVRFSYVPMIHLGDLLGIDLPITKAMVEVAGAILAKNFWETGVRLEKIGLAGLDTKKIQKFVMHGKI
jgi:opine dehydrogenase